MTEGRGYISSSQNALNRIGDLDLGSKRTTDVKTLSVQKGDWDFFMNKSEKRLF